MAINSLMFIRIPSVELIRFIAAGLVAGWILGKLRRGKGYGFFGNLAIGAIGSIIGWFLKGLLHLEITRFSCSDRYGRGGSDRVLPLSRHFKMETVQKER